MEATEAVEPAQNTPAPVPDPGPEPPARPAPRRRGTVRTLALIAVAAVIGIVGGTAVGYGVQADREPTPLPPLNQPGLAYPKPLPKGQKRTPLPASQDRQAKAQGDLRKLLLPKPAGAKKDPYAEIVDGWMSVDVFARTFESPSGSLEDQLSREIRRIAAASWVSGEHRRTEVRLIQYRAGAFLGAREYTQGQHAYLPGEKWADGEGSPVKGSTNGRFYVFPVDRKAGYLDLYEARAVFHRGDIAVEIFISDTKKIFAKEIRSLAERQLGRL
ncbi:hypothetical protein ACFWIN_10815 [Streptomyces sp. NPDC127049]|uniref:hypothetical protein n=1 Tax=Streptomyces sp. NPDC127049 TaxID=3347118 RepID=UPI00365975B9